MTKIHITSRNEVQRMSNSMVTCPHCQTLLRSDRPLPAGAHLRCPDCKNNFIAPANNGSPQLPKGAASGIIGPSFFIAVAVSLVLGGAIVTAAFILSSRRPTAEMTQAGPGPTEDERKRLEDERQKLADARMQLERESRKAAACAKLIAKGQGALEKSQFSAAEKAFNEALELLPSDADVLKGLVSARAGLLAAKSSAGSENKLKLEVDRLLADGKKALADKQYATAVRILTSARQIAPANASVNDTLLAAQKLLDADTAEKQKLADYKQHMDAAKTAMTAANYLDAVKEFVAALRLMPDDLEAQQGQKQALAKIAALGDKDKKQKALDALIADGRKAQGAKRFKDAIASLEAALRIDPDDPEAKRLLRAANDSLKQAKTDNAKLLAQADSLAKLGQLAAAKKLCDQAVDNWAEDSDAETMQKNVNQLLDNAATLQTTYRQLVQSGVLSMAAGRYADAVTAYTQALQLVPTDLNTAAALKQAQIALQQEVAVTAAANRAQLAYAGYMKSGNALLSSGAYNAAIKAFNSALTLFPGDVAATSGLSQARYSRAIAVGTQALQLRQRANAISAFQAALQEKPDDNQATLGLQKAKLLR